MSNSNAGFGTRIYFLPDSGNPQILKGSGYVSINLKGAHYRSSGNLWQKIFGGSDKVVLSTQVTRTSGTASVTSQSIEDVRQIQTGTPYYFGSGRAIALNIPADCDSIAMSVSISAVASTNLSSALSILDTGELQSTLDLAPAALAGSLTVAGIVDKLLGSTNPQTTLEGDYAGRLGTAPSPDPIGDFCLAQGTIALIYRESDSDASLDNLNASQLTAADDGLKYAGVPLENTYAMFQVSFENLRGEDPTAPWYGIFSAAAQLLNNLAVASTAGGRQQIWASAFATYQQAVNLLLADPTYTIAEAQSIAAARLKTLESAFAAATGGQNP